MIDDQKTIDACLRRLGENDEEIMALRRRVLIDGIVDGILLGLVLAAAMVILVAKGWLTL